MEFVLVQEENNSYQKTLCNHLLQNKVTQRFIDQVELFICYMRSSLKHLVLQINYYPVISDFISWE